MATETESQLWRQVPDGLDLRMEILVPLNRLGAGSRAEIARLVGTTDEVRRIEEMGLRCGVGLEMVKAGSPCIVRLQGRTLCIRADETLNVLVRAGAET